jgi:hypothetical protein
MRDLIVTENLAVDGLIDTLENQFTLSSEVDLVGGLCTWVSPR